METIQKNKEITLFNNIKVIKEVHNWQEINKYDNSIYSDINYILKENFGDNEQRPNALVYEEDFKIYSVLFFKSLFVWKKNTITHYETETHKEFLNLLESLKLQYPEKVYSINFEIKQLKLLLLLDKPIKLKEIIKGKTSLKLGTNLYTSWGYDQTNTELYKVVYIISSNYFLVLPRKGNLEQNGFMSGTLTGKQEIIKDIPLKCYISNDGYMSVCESGYKRGLYIESENQKHYTSWYA